MMSGWGSVAIDILLKKKLSCYDEMNSYKFILKWEVGNVTFVSYKISSARSPEAMHIF